jgi:hypothetical protein
MKTGWSDKVREVADREYVRPALRDGNSVTIMVGDLHEKLRAEGFPSGHTNQICTSLESEKFWKDRGLELRSPLGQPRRHSTRFEFHFRAASGEKRSARVEDDPLLGLMGILKGAIGEGADAFLKEIRRDKAGPA